MQNASLITHLIKSFKGKKKPSFLPAVLFILIYDCARTLPVTQFHNMYLHSVSFKNVNVLQLGAAGNIPLLFSRWNFKTCREYSPAVHLCLAEQWYVLFSATKTHASSKFIMQRLTELLFFSFCRHPSIHPSIALLKPVGTGSKIGRIHHIATMHTPQTCLNKLVDTVTDYALEKPVSFICKTINFSWTIRKTDDALK